jgi:hypothetical protein
MTPAGTFPPQETFDDPDTAGFSTGQPFAAGGRGHDVYGI